MVGLHTDYFDLTRLKQKQKQNNQPTTLSLLVHQQLREDKIFMKKAASYFNCISTD
jgi:hypothetical protein